MDQVAAPILILGTKHAHGYTAFFLPLPFGPTAQPGVDFVNEDTSGEKHYGNTYTQITLGQGVSNIEVLIIPLYDEDVEGLEYINVQITTNNGYSIDGSGLQYIYLYDND